MTAAGQGDGDADNILYRSSVEKTDSRDRLGQTGPWAGLASSHCSGRLGDKLSFTPDDNERKPL